MSKFFLIIPESVNLGEVERESEVKEFQNEDELIQFFLHYYDVVDFDDCVLIKGESVGFKIERNIDIHIDDH